ncbi:hypothetical protein GCM10009112_23820 [Marinomonas arenicola]|uniref:hypothetical protein n=1 Tax=Marinomonas TaxID=28253 RepID=UPI001054E887|nr:hypothetical protein [Marinomonas sp. KMM3893]
MRNLQARSATQPDLDDISNLVRFKGCYFLKKLNVIHNESNYPQRVAIITDIEGTGELELRLLGDNFQRLEKKVNDYIMLEAAVKNYKHGYFFYLAWYESVTNNTLNSEITFLNKSQTVKPNNKIYLSLFERINAITDIQIKEHCLKLVQHFNKKTNYYSSLELYQQHSNTNDYEFCVDLTAKVYKNLNIEIVGKELIQLKNQTPFKIWEKRLIGD